MKILQIVESLHNGAVENWLVNCFFEISNIKPDWKWTFYCIIENEGKLEHLVREKGGVIIKSPYTISNKKKFINHLHTFTRNNNFDIIHAHHDYLNAFYLLSFYNSNAFKISHIHNTDKHLPVKNRSINKLLIPIMKFINNIGYEKLIGISNDTIKEFKLFNHNRNNRDILYYGIELNKFKIDYNKSAFLIENNLPENAILLLFIGRFTKLKNPSFLIDILFELYSLVDLPFYILFIGEGDEKKQIIQKAIQLDLIDKIRILGWVHNPEKYFKIADVFVFPRKLSPTEGFGIVMLEAQASGIQTIVSSGVSKETIVIDEIVTIINNISCPKEWAYEILKRYSISHLANSVELLESSSFNISSSSYKLVLLYEKKA